MKLALDIAAECRVELSPLQARVWVLFLAVAELAVLACRFAVGIPTTTLAPLLGPRPTFAAETFFWFCIALSSALRFALAATPLDRSVARNCAYFHAIAIVPMTGLTLANVALRFSELSAVAVIGSALVLYGACFNTVLFYTHWTRLRDGGDSGEKDDGPRSPSVRASQSRSVSPPGTAPTAMTREQMALVIAQLWALVTASAALGLLACHFLGGVRAATLFPALLFRAPSPSSSSLSLQVERSAGWTRVALLCATQLAVAVRPLSKVIALSSVTSHLAALVAAASSASVVAGVARAASGGAPAADVAIVAAFVAGGCVSACAAVAHFTLLVRNPAMPSSPVKRRFY